ncbi:MAG: hypothetical protein HQL80_02950 [Magnetococcales bacterium]|nr:hypothetical protein [Magnetococcales bacterium]
MKKLSALVAVLSLALIVSTPAQARKSRNEVINFGSYTCQAFLEEAAQGSEEDVGIVLMWLDGYLSGISGDTVFNMKEFGEFSERLAEYCSRHGNVKLLDAAERKGIE